LQYRLGPLDEARPDAGKTPASPGPLVLDGE
jgi:hypothetical protein